MICNISCKSPVVGTVLEEVSNWHCCMRETVNKNCFQKPFRVMGSPTCCSNTEKNWTAVRNYEHLSYTLLDNWISLTALLWHRVSQQHLLHRISKVGYTTTDTQPAVRHIPLRKRCPNLFEVPSLSEILWLPTAVQGWIRCLHLSAVSLWAPSGAFDALHMDLSLPCGFLILGLSRYRWERPARKNNLTVKEKSNTLVFVETERFQLYWFIKD